MNAKVQKITVTEPTKNEDGTYTVTVKNLEDMVKSFREKLEDPRYRNLPNPQNKQLTAEVSFFALQYVKDIVYVTQGLIEAQLLEEDKLGFLSCNVTSFGKWNKVINKTWIKQAKDLLAKEEQKLNELKLAELEANPDADPEAIAELNAEKDSPLHSVDMASLATNPTCEEDSKCEVLTKKNQRWIFDKVNYTLTYKFQGSDKVIRLVPEGSWRSTILKWVVKLCAWIKKKYNDFKDRCIGIKQTIQFKIMLMKAERKAKAEAKKAEKANKASKKTEALSVEPDLDTLPRFS